MVKVKLFTTVSCYDEMSPFFKTEETVWEKYDNIEDAIHEILNLEWLGDNDSIGIDRRRLTLIASDYYYDPDEPLETRRQWTYKMGSVYYTECFAIDNE